MLNELILQEKAREFASKYWGLNFNLPVKINSKLSTSSGQYVYWIKDEKLIPRRIDIAKKLIENYKTETIFSVLKHELCHWALSISNRPFQDGHPFFEKELKRVGAPSTNTIELAGEVHEGVCEKCGEVVIEGPTRKSVSAYIEKKRKYVSKCCGEKIVYNGTIYKEDKNTSVACQLSRDVSSIVISAQPDEYSSVNNNNEMGDGSMTLVVENVKIEDLIQPNKRGKVTNAQMIPALVTAIEAGSKDQLDLLKAEYPEVFAASSTKYLNKKHKEAFLKITSGQALDEEVAEEVAGALESMQAIDSESEGNQESEAV